MRWVKGRRDRMVSLCRVPFQPWRGQFRESFPGGEVSPDVGKLWVEVWGCAFCGDRWSILAVMCRKKWDQAWRWSQRSLYMSFLDRIPKPASNGPGNAPCLDDAFAKKYPALTEFLTVSVLPDGQLRQPSSLTLFCEESVFKLCLSERDRGLTLWATGDTLLDALKQLEGRLASPKPEWRKGRSKGQQRRS